MEKFHCALITGASSGIGEGLCRYLAGEKGIDLIICGRNKEKLELLAEELSRFVNVEIVSGDLAIREDREKLVEVIHSREPDLVINNAGYGYYGEALSHTTADLLNMIDVDVVAVAEFSLEAARTLILRKKKGIIMNMSSVAAYQIFPLFAVYSSSKAFVNHFSESFDLEVRNRGVRVLASCPGMVDTNFRKRAAMGRDSKADPRSMDVSFAVEQIWWQITNEKPVYAFDWRYRLAIFLGRYILPRRLLLWVIRKNMEKRIA